MKFIRDNSGLVFFAVLIFALIGTMVLFFVNNPAGSPAGGSAPRVSESPTLRQGLDWVSTSSTRRLDPAARPGGST